MASPKKSAAKVRPSQASRGSARERAPDALALLKADHQAVKALFKQYMKLCKNDADGSEKEDVAGQICAELTIHAQVEEEIFYPALRDALEDNAILNEADVEHASAKDLIAQIERSDSGDEHYDAKLKVLGEYIDHHVAEEEGEMFKQARKADVKLKELGRQMADRKKELKGDRDQDDDHRSTASRRPRANRGNGYHQVRQ